MSAKITTARRHAFLFALAESGNVTLSAERAKVSRSWVLALRRSDAGFDGDCREALDQAKARFGLAEENPPQDSPLAPPASGRGIREWDGTRRPPAGLRYHDGVELVVRGSNGRRTQVARARVRQWTPRVEARFVSALATTCNVKAAAAAAGMSVGSAYGHRHRWPGFARLGRGGRDRLCADRGGADRGGGAIP